MPHWDKFWTRVDASAGAKACWPWTAHRSSQGYGRLRKNGRDYTAHRVAAFLAGMPVDLGRTGYHSDGSVLHSCDNPPCCNPGHLRVGTSADNVADAVARGRRRYRGTRGSANRRAKLTDALVRSIRAEYAVGGVSHRDLGKKYAVHRSVIGRLVTRVRWGWLDDTTGGTHVDME